MIQDTSLKSEEKNETADGGDPSDPSESVLVSAEDAPLEKKALSESPDSKELSGSPQSIIVSAVILTRRHHPCQMLPLYLWLTIFEIQFSPRKKKAAYPRIRVRKTTLSPPWTPRPPWASSPTTPTASRLSKWYADPELSLADSSLSSRTLVCDVCRRPQGHPSPRKQHGARLFHSFDAARVCRRGQVCGRGPGLREAR